MRTSHIAPPSRSRWRTLLLVAGASTLFACSDNQLSPDFARHRPRPDSSKHVDSTTRPDSIVLPDSNLVTDTTTQTGSTNSPSGALQWNSDWRTATGTSTEAIRDGGKWTGELCRSSVAAVVPASGLGFP